MKKFTKKQKETILGYNLFIWKIIHDIEKQFNLTGVEQNDLFQEGMLYLMEKIQGTRSKYTYSKRKRAKYNPAKSKFTTWIYPQIRRHLIRFIINQQSLFTVAEGEIYDIPEDKSDLNVPELIDNVLSDKEKEYAIAYYQDDKKQVEIAKEFHVSKQTVSKIIGQINKKIKE